MAIDRRRHDSDVMERVLGLDAHRGEAHVRTQVIDLAIQPWLAGSLVSAVELTVEELRPPRSNHHRSG